MPADATNSGSAAGPIAAFFDLDKTLIAKASLVAFSRPLHRAGLLKRRLLLRAVWGQLIYAHFGASADKLGKLAEAVLRYTAGWDQAEISALVRQTLDQVIEPIVYEEALSAIGWHKEQGHLVVVVSAAPEEVVAPIAQSLGVDEAIATRAELDAEGRYSGRTERYMYGPEKAAAMGELAARRGLDLSSCWAYSDSATDEPMLAAVGYPVAVNPDRELAAMARDRGWEVRRFRRTVSVRGRASGHRPRRAAAAGTGVTLAAAGIGALWWRVRRGEPAPPARRTERKLSRRDARQGAAGTRAGAPPARRTERQLSRRDARQGAAGTRAGAPPARRTERKLSRGPSSPPRLRGRSALSGRAASSWARTLALAFAGKPVASERRDVAESAARAVAEVDGNRTRRTGFARATGFEGRGAHQVL